MKIMKKGDMAVIFIVLILTAGLFGFRLFGRIAGECVLISVDGSESTYRLSEDRSVLLESEDGKCTVVIEDGKVFVKHSDCPEKSCMNMGKISKKGEVIACAPLKIYVKITGNGGGGYDAVAG